MTIIGVIEMRENGFSLYDCQSRFRLGSGTVQLILKRYKMLGFSLNDLKSMDPVRAETAFYPPDQVRRKPIAVPDYQKIYERLNAKGSRANLYFQWKEYKQQNPGGYQYTQFAEYYNRFIKEHYGTVDVSMAVERNPGEKMYIDWIGDTPSIIFDPETGEYKKAHVFVTTLGVSSRIYAEVFPDEKSDSFVKGTVHAVEDYGAVARYFVPDNCKTAVTKHTRDELLINATFQDLETFYGTVVLPPPARKPTGKATVERAVQYLETELLEKLKENTYTSFAAANLAAKEIVAAINSTVPNGWSVSREEAYRQYDRPQMKTLSYGSFTTCEYVLFQSVPRNYHLLFDGHYYSVFYTYYQKPVILKATMSEVMICDRNNKLICRHERSYKKFPKYITDEDHMPQAHRYYKEVNEHDGDYYRRWAAAIGPHTAQMIDIVLKSSQYEEQSYNSCNGILHMCTGISKMTVEQASARCIELKVCKYTYFKKLLNEAINKEGQDTAEALPEHENLWGDDYYK